MSQVSICLSYPGVQFQLEDDDLDRTVKVTEMVNMYNRGIENFNTSNGTALGREDFQYYPDPILAAIRKPTWQNLAQERPVWLAVMKSGPAATVQSAMDLNLSNLLAAERVASNARLEQRLDEERVLAEGRLMAEVRPLRERIAKLEIQASLASPLLVRKIVFKGRQRLIDLVAPPADPCADATPTSARVEDFSMWCKAQKQEDLYFHVTPAVLSCLLEWGPTDGNITAHNELPNEETVLAAVVEELKDPDVKEVMREVYMLAYTVSASVAQHRPQLPLGNASRPGRALVGSDRNKYKPRLPFMQHLKSSGAVVHQGSGAAAQAPTGLGATFGFLGNWRKF